jgi:hypothetical protein
MKDGDDGGACLARTPLPLPLTGMASLPLSDNSGESSLPKFEEDED